MGVQVDFFGMCLFIERTPNQFDVCMVSPPVPPEHEDHKHVATLAVPVERFPKNQPPTWHPSLVIGGGTKQVACWALPAKVIAVGTKANVEWKAGDRTDTIIFPLFHPGVAAYENDQLTNAGHPVITLAGGKIELGGTKKRAKVKQQGIEIGPVTLSSRFTWKSSGGGVTISIDDGARAIFVKDGAELSVTNVARNGFGGDLRHFQHYYLAMTHVNNPISLEQQSQPEDDVNVYDCVPPGGGS